MDKNYKCIFCSRTGIKLWHPINDVSPKICARCAQSRQSDMTYNEYVWDRYKREAHLTGRKLPLEKWEVNENGEVPSYAGPNADGEPFSYTTTLILGSTHTAFVPADEDVDWQQLPTNL